MRDRRHKWHHAETRERIGTTQLLRRLEDCAHGHVELTPVQVRAIEILLKKTIPDLNAITVSGDADNPIEHLHTIERVIVDPGHGIIEGNSGIIGLTEAAPAEVTPKNS